MKKRMVTLMTLAMSLAASAAVWAGVFDEYYDYKNEDGTYTYYFTGGGDSEGIFVTLDEEWYQNTFVKTGDGGAAFYHKGSYQAYEPKGFAGGRLFDAKRSPFGVALTPVQCIHYALTKPSVASVLCGYDTPEQVDAAVAYETAGPEEKDYAGVLARAPMHTFAGGECTSCGHCRPCPAEIDIAMVNKLYDLALMQPEVPASLREHYFALPHHADECIACRGCESRCPFGVQVADRMAKTAELFGKG